MSFGFRKIICLIFGWMLAGGLSPASAKQVSIHDPVMAREGDTYYLFSTGPGITFYSSKDLKNWRLRGRVFPGDPVWAKQVAPTFNGHIWAPDIVQHGGKNYLYYSVSAFGKNTSAIGVTVNKTLDPDSPGLNWTQATALFSAELPCARKYAPAMRPLDVWAPDGQEFVGRIWCYYSVSEFGRNSSAIGLKSCTSLAAGDWRYDALVSTSRSGLDAYNVIDPFLTADAAGKLWLAFDSGFDGIQLVTLDSAAMKPAGAIRCIVRRENGIESPNLVYANGCFNSIEKCCAGVKSTGKIACGRSAKSRGAYVDNAGVSPWGGAGTVLEIGGERWEGPERPSCL